MMKHVHTKTTMILHVEIETITAVERMNQLEDHLMDQAEESIKVDIAEGCASMHIKNVQVKDLILHEHS